jgi:ABC-2 type transport system permease protein
MFMHIYINRLKCLIRDKQLVFWTLLYPLVLATLFSLAFSNISAAVTFSKIPVAVVDNAEYKANAAFQQAVSSASAGEDPLLAVRYTSQAQAEADLKSNAIQGYILLDNGPKVVVRDNGINQTILKQFTDSYLQYTSAYVSAAMAGGHPDVNMIQDGGSYTKGAFPGKEAPNTFVIYYYALLGMAAMFGGFWGVKEIEDLQANLSARGARLNVAPVHKLKAFGASFPAAITIQFGAMLILIAYLNLVLKIDFGTQLPYIILTCLAGSIMGVTYGAMLGSVFKNEHLKTALLITTSMAFSFLAGMMVPGVRYAVAHAAPWLTYINPAHLISDAFYSLYYYTGYGKFLLSIGLLLGLSVVCYLVVYFKTRRQKYASL